MKRVGFNMKFIAVMWLSAGIIAGCANQNKQPNQEQAAKPAKPKNFERAVPPALLTSPQERAGYLVTHFWDKFDFKDTMYCHTPEITEEAFSNFLNLFQYVSPEKVKEGVNKLMTAAAVENVMYEYFANKAEHYLYNPNSPMRNDGYYIPFLEHIVASPKIDDDHKIRPRSLLTLAYKNRIGTKALDFSFTMASGKTEQLYSISAPYLLLAFYNPECKECQRTLDIMKNSPIITSAVSSGKLKVLTVYPDEKLDAWKRHAEYAPASWIDGYDKSLNVKNNELYDLKAIPSLYLLDKDKTVLFKDAAIENIQAFLEQNMTI